MPTILRHAAHALTFAAFQAANALSRPNDGSRASAIADAMLSRLMRDVDCVECSAYLGATTEFAPSRSNLLCRGCAPEPDYDRLPAA